MPFLIYIFSEMGNAHPLFPTRVLPVGSPQLLIRSALGLSKLKCAVLDLPTTLLPTTYQPTLPTTSLTIDLELE